MFKETWEQLQNMYHPKNKKNNLNINININLKFKTFDADDHPEIMKEANINGFPTIRLHININKAKEFNDSRSLDNLISFINSHPN